MSARSGIAFLLVGCAALPAGFASAQACELQETVSVCYARLSGASASAVKTSVAATEEEEAKTANAGVDTAAAGTASATKNFIPLLRVAGLVGDGITTEDGLVAFDVNFPFPTPGVDQDTQLQLVVNPSPVLHEALGTALDTLGDAALRDELEGSLSDNDDVRVSFTYGKTGENLGRNFEQYRKMFASLVEGAVKEAVDSAVDAAGSADAYTDFLSDMSEEVRAKSPDALPRGTTTDINNLRFDRITDLATRTQLMEGVAAEAIKQGQSQVFLSGKVTENQLHRFADLVANQPQLYVSVERRLGSELTGPRRTSVDVTWERGLVSLGKFDQVAPETCTQEKLVATTVAPVACVTAFKNFVTDNLDDIDSAGRLAFSLGYSKVHRYSFSRPLSGLNVSVPSTEKLTASFTFGSKVAAAQRSELFGEDSRVDFIVKYEHSDDETVLNSRTIAGLTFSRKLGESVMPVTLLYSDKGEMAGDSGREITVNFGLAFQLIQ